MDQSKFTKSELRLLRDLSGKAWDNELSLELAKLEVAFAEWHAGTCSPHELNDKIHQFHQGPSRELYSCYTGCDSWLVVARAVRMGLLLETDLPEGLLAKLTPALDFYGEEV